MPNVYAEGDGDKKYIIPFDKILHHKNEYWFSVEIDKQTHFFSYALVELDEDNNQITAPLWLLKSKGLDNHIIGEET